MAQNSSAHRRALIVENEPVQPNTFPVLGEMAMFYPPVCDPSQSLEAQPTPHYAAWRIQAR